MFNNVSHDIPRRSRNHCYIKSVYPYCIQMDSSRTVFSGTHGGLPGRSRIPHITLPTGKFASSSQEHHETAQPLPAEGGLPPPFSKKWGKDARSTKLCRNDGLFAQFSTSDARTRYILVTITQIFDHVYVCIRLKASASTLYSGLYVEVRGCGVRERRRRVIYRPRL